MFNKFFKAYPELALIGLAILFVAVIGGLYFWGISALFKNLNEATAVVGEGQGIETSFDLEGARALKLAL